MEKKPISITIIFNDNILNIPIVHLEYNGDHHGPLIKRICEIYHININIDNYIEDLLSNNHIVIVTVLNNIAVYIPETITNNQFEKLKTLRQYFNSFSVFEASVSNNCNSAFKTITDINVFFEYVENNCIERTRR